MSVVGSVPVVVSVASGGGTVSDGASAVVVVASPVSVVDSVVVVESCTAVRVVSLPGSVDSSPGVVLSGALAVAIDDSTDDSPFELHEASNVTRSIALSVTQPQARRIINEFLVDPMGPGYSTESSSNEYRVLDRLCLWAGLSPNLTVLVPWPACYQTGQGIGGRSVGGRGWTGISRRAAARSAVASASTSVNKVAIRAWRPSVRAC